MSDLVLVTGRDPATLMDAASRAAGEAIPWVGADNPRKSEATVWFASGLLPESPCKLPRLRWIHSAWAGIDRWLTRSEWRADIKLTRTVADFPERIAEHVLGYLLAESLELDRARGQQSESLWKRYRPGTLAGKEMLVVGFGAIGRRVAACARAFGMIVRGVRRGPLSDDDRANGVETPEALPSLLPRAQVIVNLLPAYRETESFWNAARFDLIGEDAVFVNVSRGRCVDDAALLAALDRGRLALAILDVFREEPLPRESPYWRHPRVRVTPHVAGLGDAATEGTAFGENWRRWLDGAPLLHVVDRARGY